MLPTAPLFPLPNVVLFPNVFLPLHIFEPRYREMVADALAGDRIDRHGAAAAGLGARLRGPAAGLSRSAAPASSPTSSGSPTAATTSSCAALEHSASSSEDHARSYRRAAGRAAGCRRSLRAEDRDCQSRAPRSKLEALLAPAVEKARRRSENAAVAWPTKIWSTRSAQYLDLEPLEKQALLEHDSLRARAESLIELLEMKIMIARTPGLSNVAH